MQWTAHWQVLSDDPAKAQKGDSPMERSNVLRGLTAELAGAKSRIELISPYFIPGEHATALLTKAATGGREVEILTNSLAANDVAAVHSGYAEYRQELLKGGVKLWELKPESSRAKSMSLLGSSGASLHTKAAVIDDRSIFVGSFNLDPRSVSLNCEQGILVDQPELAAELHQLFVAMTSPASAWRVEENAKGQLEWTDGTQTFDKEPQTTWSKRMRATVMGWLPIQAQL
jgi:putative cardiolipin synthase